jgi:protein-S-isoprenylcysteine O-methyltransferase Ste14
MLKLPPPVWMFLALIIAGAVSWSYEWRSLVDLRILWLGIALVAIGFASASSAFLLFQREGTQLDPTSETNQKLVVRGPFCITRNPMYLGLVILTLGLAFLVGSLPMFAVPLVVFAIANWVHIPFEEAKMRRQFGTAFENYTNQVRRWI